ADARGARAAAGLVGRRHRRASPRPSQGRDGPLPRDRGAHLVRRRRRRRGPPRGDLDPPRRQRDVARERHEPDRGPPPLGGGPGTRRPPAPERRPGGSGRDLGRSRASPRPGLIPASLSGLLGSEHLHRVIVAEDDEAFLDALEAVLEADGRFAVVGRARNGREAVELVARLKPDLVVMDIEMPVMDGIEATRVLRQRLPGLPVVAISGHDYEERVLEIRAAGADDYVRKARLEEEL